MGYDGWTRERGFLFAAAADGRLAHISAEREQKRTGGFWMDMDPARVAKVHAAKLWKRSLMIRDCGQGTV